MRSLNRRKQAGFTLLELLVVVAILAIIGGGILVAYDDLDDSAAEGVAAHTLQSLDSAVRNFEVMEKALPNELDSLLAADYPADPEDATTPLTGGARLPILQRFPQTSDDKGINITLTAPMVTALNAAGITHLRYVDALANNSVGPFPITLDVPDANGGTATANSILTVDIPSRVFETPRPGNANRGRGFAKRIGVGDPVIRWNPNRSGGGTGGFDNIKIGAGPDDIVLVFGLGNDASNIGSAAGPAQLPNAPVYGKGQPYHYSRYLLAVNLGPAAAPLTRARLQVVLNTHGDFMDEMLSEHSGQKP